MCTWRSKFSDADRERKKGGVSRLFFHQWLILCHFVDVKQYKIKLTNVSAILVDPYTTCGDKELAYIDTPRDVEQLQESDENNEEVLL